jgi:hypothetical protein
MSHPPSAEGIVLVDFDGTIVAWGSLRNPVLLPMAGSAVRALKGEGYTVGIFTSRLSAAWHRAEGRDPFWGCLEQKKIITDFLVENEIPFDFITAEKVPALLYLDDKAMRVSEARPLNDAVDAFLAMGDDAL